MDTYQARLYGLLTNYRSKANLVDFANRFANRIAQRLKEQPVVAHQKEQGELRIVKYSSDSMIYPLVEAVTRSSLTGTTGILTCTNEEAELVHTCLCSRGLPSKLVQEGKGFRPGMLQELYEFTSFLELSQEMYLIPEESWQQAVMKITEKYEGSRNWEICRNVLTAFEDIYPEKRYKTDWEHFTSESRLEDFYTIEGEQVVVSTIHKAKGKEFDRLFLLLPSGLVLDDETKRKIYVALTRARNRLEIHLCGNYLDAIQVDNLEVVEDRNDYLFPAEIGVIFSLGDVWLSRCAESQPAIAALRAGDCLVIEENRLTDSKGRTVLRFSQKLKQKLEEHRRKGYYPSTATVNFMVYWYDKERARYLKVPLPQVMVKKDADGIFTREGVAVKRNLV